MGEAKPPGRLSEILMRAAKGISAKEAVVAASKHFMEVTGNTSGVTVEELELSKDGKHWLVTLGYQEVGYLAQKSYKVFKVNAKTGSVVSMKMRGV